MSQINDRNNEVSEVRNDEEKRELFETVENQEVMIRELSDNLHQIQ